MPCEGCEAQFTVFRRKRSCSECKRYYCSNCLTIDSPTKTSTHQLIHGTTSSSSSSLSLCLRCVVFMKRPLLRNDLLQLKPKDLIFYLQSKHISTAGCVEKDELIGLVLNHIQRDTNHGDTQQQHQARASSGGGVGASGRRTSRIDDESLPHTSFRNIKQTCQNFFTNISENLQGTLSAFDDNHYNKHKPSTTTTTTPPTSASTPTNPKQCNEQQPRVSTRVLPTYASVQANKLSPTTSTTPPPSEDNNNSTSSRSQVPTILRNERQNESNFNLLAADVCFCSDNEEEGEDDGAVGENGDKKEEDVEVRRAPETEIHVANGFEENSSQSSFEELGAIGGLSDETSSSKTPADSNSGTSNNLEQWHLLDTPANAHKSTTTTTTKSVPVVQETTTTTTTPTTNIMTVSQIPKTLSRHHSEGFLQLRRQWQQQLSSEEIAPSTSGAANLYERDCCKRCGKHKTNMRQLAERMRRQLESTHMSEADIKRELNAFLEFLENRSKSLDNDDEDDDDDDDDGDVTTERSNERNSRNFHISFYDDNEGIHVYGLPVETPIETQATPNRFINLDDFDTLQQLESLTVKQLKEVLMLNRVDYKGCLEKQELLERVERLWKNLKSTPALEQLPTDELCKICMDAPIECVILECGHMATCTNCGKVLSECPICRQYIVRVVRFFRA